MHPKIPESDETLWDCFALAKALRLSSLLKPSMLNYLPFLFGFLPTQIQTSAPIIKIIAAISGK